MSGGLSNGLVSGEYGLVRKAAGWRLEDRYGMRVSGPDQTLGFFDRIAEGYSETRYGTSADPWRLWFFGERLRLATELLGPEPGRVLDLGAGPGVLADALSGVRAEVVSLDLSAQMLRGREGRAVVGDAIALPIRPGSVDVVAALGLTTYLPGLRPFLAEARRALRPGGRLLFSITRRESPDTVLRGLYRATLGRFGRGNSVLRSGVRVRTFSEGETRRALDAAGFAVKAIRRHNTTVFPFCYLLKSWSLRRDRERTARGDTARASDALFLAVKRERPEPVRARPIRVLRTIARLNVGGPARQAILLTKRLDERGYRSTLVTGSVGPDEGDMLPDAICAGVRPVVLPGLGRDLSALGDLRALFGLCLEMVRMRPDVVHTHTAKAGTLGRVAAFLTGVPVRVHTFHGHVLHGYFGPRGSALVRAAELLLARITTRVIAVSAEVKDDLCRRHRAIPASRVTVVPLGLDLTLPGRAAECRGELRAEFGIGADEPVISMVGRLVPVKEPGTALEVAAQILAEAPRARFLLVGGGELLEPMRARARELGLGDRVLFPGFRTDLDRILADTDLALLTSRNEGTPVALIEAAAAGVPAVATRVGGVPSVVVDGETGVLVPHGDPAALARAILELLADPDRRREMGRAARARALMHFDANRLLQDIDDLYRVCLAKRRWNS